MLCTTISFEQNETKGSKDSLGLQKKSEISPIRLPRIKIDADPNFLIPVVKIKSKPHKSLEKTLYKIKNMKAIKVNDITETMSKDLPKTLFRNIVISPRQTSKIFASIDISQSYEAKSHKSTPSPYRKTKTFRSQSHNPGLEKILKEIENTSEFFKATRAGKGTSATRPISPWLYQGNSRRFSIFMNNK